MELPRLRLLGYEETRPNLRLIRLPEVKVEPSPVPLNKPPLDRATRLDGWIAFDGVWGVPIPLEGDAFFAGEYSFWTPSANERALWLAEPKRRSGTRHVYVEYDGVAREVVDRIELPRDAFLISDDGEALLAYEWAKGWSRWERGASTGEAVAEQELPPEIPPFRWSNDPNFRFRSEDGEVVEVDLPAGAQGHAVCESPDGRWIVLDIDVSGPRAEVSFADIARGSVEYEPRPHRLGLVDRSSATLTLATGSFDNFASAPVWSFDSEWLVFAAPFMPNGLWSCRVTDREPRLEWIPFGRSAPVPLVNVSDLIRD